MLISESLCRYLGLKQVPFALIGGVTMAAWGLARYTADVDLLTMDPPHDLIVGKGAASTLALERRREIRGLPCPVADPMGIILLKLEAGSPQDAYDILGLLNLTGPLAQPHLEQDVEHALSALSSHAKAMWVKVQGLR